MPYHIFECCSLSHRYTKLDPQATWPDERHYYNWVSALCKTTVIIFIKEMLSLFEKKLIDTVKFTCHKHAVLTKSVYKGIGWGCVETIRSGEVILAIPPQTWLPYSADYAAYEAACSSPNLVRSIKQVTQQLKNNADSDNKVNADLYDRMESSIFLAAKLMLDRNDRIPYVDFLASQSISSPLPMSCSAEMLHCLNPKYSTFNNIVARQKLYRAYINVLGESNKESFLWAMSQILSRGLSSSLTDSKHRNSQLPFTMVPILDFVNHADEPNAYYEYVNSTNPTEKDMMEYKDHFVLKASNDIQPDTEICISYGKDRCNSSFFTLYGFISQGNPKLSSRNIFQCHALFTKDSLGVQSELHPEANDSEKTALCKELLEINLLVDGWKKSHMQLSRENQYVLSIEFELNLDNLKYFNKLPAADVPKVFSEMLHISRVCALNAQHVIDFYMTNRTPIGPELELTSEKILKLLDEFRDLKYVHAKGNIISIDNEIEAVRHLICNLEGYCEEYGPISSHLQNVDSKGAIQTVDLFKSRCDYLNNKEREYWVAIKCCMEKYLEHLHKR